MLRSLLFLLFFPFSLYAQKDSTEFVGEKNPWIEILGLTDNNVETVETAVTESISGGTTSKLFVFGQDNSVRYFSIFTPSSESSDAHRSIKERNVNKSTEEYYLNLLQEARKNNFNGIEVSQLNITIDGPRVVKIMDGRVFHFRYIGYDYYKAFVSYAPGRYIQNRIQGWEHRQRLLNLIASFNKEVKW